MRYGKDRAAASALEVDEEVADVFMVGDKGPAAELAGLCGAAFLGSLCRRNCRAFASAFS